DVGEDFLYAANGGQRVRAALDDLELTLARGVLHGDVELTGARGDIGRTADAADLGVWTHPVREIAGLGDLQPAQHGDVEVAATHDRERLGRVHEPATRH